MSKLLNQFLVIGLQGERLAFNIQSVQEILQTSEVTKIPSSLDYVDGVIALRNRVIPLINLKWKLYKDRHYANGLTVVVVEDEEKRLYALKVDEVLEVLTIPDSCIEKPIFFSNSFSDSPVSGVGKLDSGLVIILDLQALLPVTDKLKMTELLESE